MAILVDTSTAWGRRLIGGVIGYCQKCGPWLIRLEDHGQNETFRVPRGWDGDGIVARVADRGLARHLGATGLPVVNVSAIVLRGVDFPRVTYNARTAGQLAAEYFLNRGFRHFAFVGDTPHQYLISRFEAFNEALAKAGCFARQYQASLTSGSQSHWMRQQRELARWLLQQPKPLALFTWAMRQPGRIIEACMSAGLAIPEQVALLGGDDDPVLYGACHPPVSGVIVPSHVVGHEAAALLDSLMQGKPPPKRPILVKPTGIVTRQSTNVLAVEDGDVTAALQFIRQHASEPMQVDDVLRAVAVSRSALERRFQQILGRSVWAELHRTRMDRARSLLVETDMPIPHVADASGFGSPEYMSYVFKRATGLTPREYRKQGERKSWDGSESGKGAIDD